jgi:hypothetical protein
MCHVDLFDWKLSDNRSAIGGNSVYPLVYMLGVFPAATMGSNILIGTFLECQGATLPQIFRVTFRNGIFAGESVLTCFKGFVAGFV